MRGFDGKEVLVTGGTGLIGRQVVDLLCGAGARVRIVSLDRIRVHDKAEHVVGDLRDFEFCRHVTANAEFVFHLAGIKGSVSATHSQIASHFVPTLMFNTNVLEACRINKVRKIVYTSSVGAYAHAEILKESNPPDGPPMDFAGWAKRMGELQILAYRKEYELDNFAVVRPANVYGPGDNFDPQNAMVIPSLMYRIAQKENPLVIWGDGSAVRDFAFSRDVAEGVILALVHGTPSGFVNLGSGQGVSIRELVETLHSIIPFHFRFDPAKPAGVPRRVMDISLARSTIEYSPSTALIDGLKETWKWYLAHPDEHRAKFSAFAPADSGQP